MISDKQKVFLTSGYNHYHEVMVPSCESQIVLSLYESVGNDPVVIFLPGTMTHPLFYDEFLSLLANNGLTIIGVHFLSHGKSPREKQHFTISDLIQNVKDAVTFSLNTYQQRPMLLGSSQGGILSLLTAGKDHRIHSVFAHNVLLTSLKDSIKITRYPAWFKHTDKIFKLLLKAGGKLMPAFPVPGTSYLDLKRVFRDESLKEYFLSDPIGRLFYPLSFLASLINADTSCITDGSVSCPVVVIASKQDPLFPFDYCQKVYEQIVAPEKEMMLFDEPNHLLFNECVEKVSLPVIEKLKEYASAVSR